MGRILVVALLISISVLQLIQSKDLGKLDCTEKDGLKPDSKLINLIVSKCQPKQGQPTKTQAACLLKCLLKQQKAVDKKGKLKMKDEKVEKAEDIVSIFPDKFKSNITERLNHCAKENNEKLKKEPNGCDSWLPFTECFYEYGKTLCPTEKEREEAAKKA